VSDFFFDGRPNAGFADDPNKELLERHALLQSPVRIEELAKIFIHATKVSVSSQCMSGHAVLHFALCSHLLNTQSRWRLHFGRCTARAELGGHQLVSKSCSLVSHGKSRLGKNSAER
jgi:hypothetical protein